MPTTKARKKMRLPAKKARTKVVQAASDTCLFCQDLSVVDTWIQCMDCHHTMNRPHRQVLLSLARGSIIACNYDLHCYKVSFVHPNANRSLRSTKWVPVSNITSLTRAEENKRRRATLADLQQVNARKKYFNSYIWWRQTWIWRTTTWNLTKMQHHRCID